MGYGPHTYSPQLPGRVALWSPENPAYPAWTFVTVSGEKRYMGLCVPIIKLEPCNVSIQEQTAGVTALAFSSSNPTTLAVGHFHGSVALYDTRSRSSTPIAACTAGDGSHSDPVWALCWVAASGRGEQAESLVSTSTDGRVVQWSLSKVHRGLNTCYTNSIDPRPTRSVIDCSDCSALLLHAGLGAPRPDAAEASAAMPRTLHRRPVRQHWSGTCAGQ